MICLRFVLYFDTVSYTHLVQIKMVQAMSVLLDEYEREGYYRRSRQRYETRNVPSNDHHNSNGNNRPNFNNRTNHNNEAYNRPNFNNRGNNNNKAYYRPNNNSPGNNRGKCGNRPKIPTNQYNWPYNLNYRQENNNSRNYNNNHSPINQNQDYRRVNYVRAEDNGNGRSHYQGRQSSSRDTYWNQDDHANRRGARTNGGRSRSHEGYRRNNYEDDHHQPEPRPAVNEDTHVNQNGRRDEESEPALNSTRQ